MPRSEVVRVELTFKPDELALVDAARGLVPRATWIKALALNPPGALGDAAVEEQVGSFEVQPVHLESFAPVSRKAIAEERESRGLDAMTGREVDPDAPFKCRVCEFTAKSENARCPHHGGKLVPA